MQRADVVATAHDCLQVWNFSNDFHYRQASHARWAVSRIEAPVEAGGVRQLAFEFRRLFVRFRRRSRPFIPGTRLSHWFVLLTGTKIMSNVRRPDSPSNFDPLPKKIPSGSQEGKLILALQSLLVDHVVKLTDWHGRLPDGEVKSEMRFFLKELKDRFARLCREAGIDPWLQDPGSN